MPCDSSYMAPTQVELECRQNAKFICFIYNKLGWGNPYYGIIKDSKNIYCSNRGLEIELCGILGNLTDDEINRVIYDARDKMSRRLADWWEAHVEKDKKRESKETQKKELGLKVQKIIGSLTNEEIQVLEDHYGIILEQSKGSVS